MKVRQHSSTVHLFTGKADSSCPLPQARRLSHFVFLSYEVIPFINVTKENVPSYTLSSDIIYSKDLIILWQNLIKITLKLCHTIYELP